MYYSQPGYPAMGSGQSQAPTKPNRLMVTGEGSVYANPDRAVITIGVITETET